jgi:hypothetical protein
MKQKLYTIKDNKAGLNMSVWEAPNDLVAIRQFSETINQKDRDGKPANNLGKYPKDFELYSLGLWDNETGIITPEYTMLQSAETFAEQGEQK